VAVITLTTDFGQRDPYVAAMKGVILTSCPQARILDLSHDIAPQDTHEAARFVAGAAPYFPAGTIHVVVVDPGVGTPRRPLAVRAGGQVFLCPDNGVLTEVARALGIEEAREIANPAFMRDTISNTFHGRDVFAPAAAHLARGTSFESIGPCIGDLCALDEPEPIWVSATTLCGIVAHVDRFGNAATNIARPILGGRCIVDIAFGNHTIAGLRATYAAVDPGAPLALFNGSDHLEIAVRNGSATEKLGLVRGTEITIHVESMVPL